MTAALPEALNLMIAADLRELLHTGPRIAAAFPA